MSQSLARALQILGELGERSRSLDDLSEVVGVHKTTVLRLLRTLEGERFVRRDDRHRYSLGSRMFELGSSALAGHHIRDVALPHLHRLGEATGGQAVHMAALEGTGVVYIAKVESTSSVRMYSRVGLPAPLHATAVGKVLAADLSPGDLERVLRATTFEAFTEHTITDAPAYRAELDAVRARGWAADRAEHEAFINCIAAPVRDGTRRVIAAVSISVPEVILTQGEVHGLLPHLLEATAAIETDWTMDPTNDKDRR